MQLQVTEISHNNMCYILILAITSVLRKVKERKVKGIQSVYKSDSLTNKGIKKNKRKEEENGSFKDRKKFKEERYMLFSFQDISP